MPLSYNREDRQGFHSFTGHGQSECEKGKSIHQVARKMNIFMMTLKQYVEKKKIDGRDIRL